MQPRGNIDRQYRRVHRRIHGLDSLAPFALNVALEPGTEERVNDYVAVAQASRFKRVHGHARVACRVAGAARVALQPVRITQSQRLHLQPGNMGQPRHHIAVTAVVAGPAHDRDAPRPWPLSA